MTVHVHVVPIDHVAPAKSSKFYHCICHRYIVANFCLTRCFEFLLSLVIFTRFILERGLKGFPHWKKMPHEIYVAASNGAQKNRPKDKYYFF